MSDQPVLPLFTTRSCRDGASRPFSRIGGVSAHSSDVRQHYSHYTPELEWGSKDQKAPVCARVGSHGRGAAIIRQRQRDERNARRQRKYKQQIQLNVTLRELKEHAARRMADLQRQHAGLDSSRSSRSGVHKSLEKDKCQLEMRANRSQATDTVYDSGVLPGREFDGNMAKHGSSRLVPLPSLITKPSSPVQVTRKARQQHFGSRLPAVASFSAPPPHHSPLHQSAAAQPRAQRHESAQPWHDPARQCSWYWPAQRDDEQLISGDAAQGTLEVRPRGAEVHGDGGRLARGGHSAVLAPGADPWVQKRLVVFGGLRFPAEFLNDTVVYEVESCRWAHPVVEGEVPVPRHGHVAVMVGAAQMLVHGGIGDGETVLGDIHVLNLVTWRWSKLHVDNHDCVMPSPLDRPPEDVILSSMNGGGTGPRAGTEREGRLSRLREERDRRQRAGLRRRGAHKFAADPVPEPRYQHAAAFLGTVVVMFGGRGRRYRLNDNRLWMLQLPASMLGGGLNEPFTWSPNPGVRAHWKVVSATGVAPPTRFGHCFVALPTIGKGACAHDLQLQASDVEDAVDEDAIFTPPSTIAMVGGEEEIHCAVAGAEVARELVSGTGGVVLSNGSSSAIPSSAATMAVWFLDTKTLIWTKLVAPSEMTSKMLAPPPCYRGAAAVVARRLVIFGGLRCGTELPLLGVNGDGLSSYCLVNGCWQARRTALQVNQRHGFEDVAVPAPALRYGHSATPSGDGRVLIFGGYGVSVPAAQQKQLGSGIGSSSGGSAGDALIRGALCVLDVQTAREAEQRRQREFCAACALEEQADTQAAAIDQQRKWYLEHTVLLEQRRRQQREDLVREHHARLLMHAADKESLSFENGPWCAPPVPDPPTPDIFLRMGTASSICVGWRNIEPANGAGAASGPLANLVFILRMSKRPASAYMSRLVPGHCSAELEHDFDVVFVGPYPKCGGVVIDSLLPVPRVDKFKRDAEHAEKYGRAKPEAPTETRFFSLQYYNPRRNQLRSGQWVGWFSPPRGFPSQEQIRHATLLVAQAARRRAEAAAIEADKLHATEADRKMAKAETVAADKAMRALRANPIPLKLAMPVSTSDSDDDSETNADSPFHWTDMAFSTDPHCNENALDGPGSLLVPGLAVQAKHAGGRKWKDAIIDKIDEIAETVDVRFVRSDDIAHGLPFCNVRLGPATYYQST